MFLLVAEKFKEKSVILITESTFLRHYFVLFFFVPPKTKRIYFAILQKFEVPSVREENNSSSSQLNATI